MKMHFSYFIFSITILLMPSLAHTQSETDDLKKVSYSYVEHFNSGSYDKIFEMFAPSMQEFLPLDKTTVFLKGLHDQLGPIQSMEFEKFDQGYASYKTQFKAGTPLSTKLAIDDKAEIVGLSIVPWEDTSIVVMERNVSQMILPFTGEWTVFWGGDSKEINHHYDNPAQKHALDIVIIDESGSTHTGDGTKNEDYYCFGKPLIAPAAGEVVLVVDGINDNPPGKVNPYFVPGNTVVLKTENEEYIYFAHFKKQSITVIEGQMVNQGDLLGLCGNSGNSTEAHLHFHVQNTTEMYEAKGIKTYFSDILVNGESKDDYSPIRMDKVENKNVIHQQNNTTMELGCFSVSLSVKDLATSKAFYENLGFEVYAGAMEMNYLIMKNGSTNIGLFQGMFEGNLMTFNPGWDQDAKPIDGDYTDVRDIQKHLKSKGVNILSAADESTTGPASCTFTDPDGNVILLDQHR